MNIDDMDLLGGLNLSKDRKETIEKTVNEYKETIKEAEIPIEKKADQLTKVLKKPKLEDPQEKLTERLTRLYEFLDYIFNDVIDLKEEGAEHSKHMYGLSARTALKLGFDSGFVINYISYSALLHDIGKWVLPGHVMEVLQEGEQLPVELYENLKLHTTTGSLLLKKVSDNLSDLSVIPTMVLCHHEEIDGNGYLGLRGNEIPLVSKIISVVDSYLSIARKRSYDPKTPHKEVLEELKRCADLPFDADLLYKSNKAKIESLKHEDMGKYGKGKGSNYYHKRLKMKFERNTRKGKRLPEGFSMSYEEVLDSDLSVIENAYLRTRLMPEYQFSSKVVTKFEEFLTDNPKTVEEVLKSDIMPVS